MILSNPIYSEKDQAIIDNLHYLLDCHEGHIYMQCKKTGMNEQEMQNHFLNDSIRNEMIKNIAHVKSLMIPSYDVKL